jgi:hypothetical protein
MLAPINSTINRCFSQSYVRIFLPRFVFVFVFFTSVLALANLSVAAQVTGGFTGSVKDSAGNGIPGALIRFKSPSTGLEARTTSDQSGNFTKQTLPPGDYVITVEANGITATVTKSLFTTRLNEVLPPIILEKEEPKQDVAITVPTSTPTSPPNTTTGNNTNNPSGEISVSTKDVDTSIVLNPRRDGAFDERAVQTIPLGGTTLTRTFDELAFYVPGVAPPPQAIGNTVGPGVGGGVGTSGQFSVNGLRSRANNFTVDGSDNNDEDIGVRRQGFFTLVPQPIESIKEFQIITLLAPAEFGRNFGGQVNVNSKTGGNDFHGSIYGIGNADFLNARNPFDNASGDRTTTLQAIRFGELVNVCLNAPIRAAACPAGNELRVTNNAGEKDAFSLLQGGFAFGGRIVRDKMFFFISGEGQHLDGTQERHFAVPTVEQRTVFGASQGLQACFGSVVNGVCRNAQGNPINFSAGFPTSAGGDAVFSLFPFPNDPTGIYGRNTYTQALSIDAIGRILSGRYDWNIFNINGNQQRFTARYNYTDDERDLTDVGGAIFSAIRPLVRTDNFSTFLSGSLTDNLSNELRFSLGRTRLRFEEIPDATGFLLPVDSSIIRNPEERRFLLNARLISNVTLPPNCNTMGCFGNSLINYRTTPVATQISTQALPDQFAGLGPVGQVIVAGFSPVGVDVFNFPQERKNNTYQIADTLRWQFGTHAVSIGTDIRRAFLDSNLPRNSRPLVTFNGGGCIVGNSFGCPVNASDPASIFNFALPTDLAAAGAATGFFQSLILPNIDPSIELSYYQFNFFAQDEWRINPRLNITYGLRYEYNTVPREANNKIENTFQLQQNQFPVAPPDLQLAITPNLFRGFSDFIAGRTGIYDPDRNNFAPRVGFAWSPVSDTVVRGGYGLFYDQIIGAVVSQSRNQFPTFTNVNTGGGDLFCEGSFTLLNPINGRFDPSDCFTNNTIVAPGTLNTLNPAFNRLNLLAGLLVFPGDGGVTFGATIPDRNLEIPMAHQYSVGIEQKLFGEMFVSAAYVGTLGRKLLRFTTPNLGSNFIAVIDNIIIDVPVFGQPQITGFIFDPSNDINTLGRPNRNIGPVSQFETTGRSRYDSLQIGLRGRLARSFQYRASYVYGEVKDDVSDVFDLAGAFALPQNSRTFAGEYAAANFDVRHRLTYSFIYDLPGLRNQNSVARFLLGGWQIAGTGRFNTGQPFTVNSIFDVNLDGNLTDRLDNTAFITESTNRRQRLGLACQVQTTCRTMLADFGEDGSVPRNSFRAGDVLELDMSFAKRFATRSEQNLEVRFDVFNFVNRANYGVPVRFLEFPSFGQATETITPGRRIQLLLRYNF